MYNINETYTDDMGFSVKHISGMGQSKSALPHIHSSKKFLFVYCEKGAGGYVINGKNHIIEDGEIVILKPSEFFLHYIIDTVYHERIVLNVDARILQAFPPDYFPLLSPFHKRNDGTKNVISVDCVKEYGIDKLMNDILKYMRSNDKADSALAFARVIEFLSVVGRVINDDYMDNIKDIQRNEIVNNILQYIDRNYADEISIQSIADYFNFDRSYLSHKFKEQVGVSIWEYVILRRIYMFNTLVNDKMSTEETAYRVGFKNYSNFYRLYKKHMGISPKKYCKQHTAQIPSEFNA